PGMTMREIMNSRKAIAICTRNARVRHAQKSEASGRTSRHSRRGNIEDCKLNNWPEFPVHLHHHLEKRASEQNPVYPAISSAASLVQCLRAVDPPFNQ